MAYDTVLGYLNGTLRYADSPSTVYVAGIKGHPDFVKIGFCQLSFRNQRRADPFIGEILYESCRDEELQIMAGDMPRSMAFLLEQWLHERLTHTRETIPELVEIKWPGRFETFRIPAAQRASFVDWIAATVGFQIGRGLELNMLDDLVASAEERELLIPLQEQAEKERRERMARIEKLRVTA